MTTYPNQKVIHINKNKYTANFLQVGIDEWQTAFKKFTPSAFAVYLYLASNADGFDLALSQKAIENALGIKKTAYHSAIEALKKEGYIEVLQGNIEVFHTAPVRKCEPEIINTKNRTAPQNQTANTAPHLNVNVNDNVNENENKNVKVNGNSTAINWNFTAPVRKNELKTEEAIFRKNELKSSQMRNTNSAKTNLEVRKNDIEIDNINNIDIIDKEFLPTEEILDGFAIEPVKQESINQNNEADGTISKCVEGTISECGAQFQNVSGAQSEIVYNIKEINNNNKKEIDIGDFVASQQNPATSLASQVSSVKQVEAVGADKVISVACSDMRDSYYHLYKYLAKYQPALASFVVNSVAFCGSNKERTDKAIEICNTYGYTVDFNDTAVAVANA